jgi:transcriptional regulator with XRE-family HTH domain
MLASEFIQKAQATGWRVISTRDGVIKLKCRCHGCKATLIQPIKTLAAIPQPCGRSHHGLYAAGTYDEYKSLVAVFIRKRRSLGLSQEDLCAAAGLADGHVNKLEAFARTAQMPTLQLWAKTLGLEITVVQTDLPAATVRAIEHRSKPLREIKTVQRTPLISDSMEHSTNAA